MNQGQPFARKILHEKITLGPLHPFIDDLIQFDVVHQDELISEVVPRLGWNKKGLDKLCTEVDIGAVTHLMSFIDGYDSANWMLAYVLLLESGFEKPVPARAQYLRVICAELSRIRSHLRYLIMMGKVLGIDAIALRFNLLLKKCSSLAYEYFGDKLMRRYFRLGGVSHDLDDVLLGRLESKFNLFYELFRDETDAFFGISLVQERLRGFGVISPHVAGQARLTGPGARALGLPSDLRGSSSEPPLFIYSEFNVTPVCESGGDAWDRLNVHIREITASIYLIKQCCRQIPFGTFFQEPEVAFDQLKEERSICVEGARGQISVTVHLNRRSCLEKIVVAPPDATTLDLFVQLSKGLALEDFFLLYVSLDILPQTIAR
jgi:ech hydrogenase subunit E